MADQKRQITFETTMTADKRAESAAYLRKNVLDTPTQGLYPAADFVATSPTLTSDDQVAYIFNDASRDWVLVPRYDGTDSLRFYELGSNSTTNTSYSGYLRVATIGGDGVYFVDWDTNTVHDIRGSGSAQLAGTFDFSPLIELGGWDGLQYWWVGADIWRQIPREDPVLMMDQGVPGGVEFMDFYGDEMVLFLQTGADVTVLFYDKSNSAYFTRRETVKNSTLLAGGVVEGRLMLVYAVGNSANPKESRGEIVVAGWSGQDFVQLNSIITPREGIRIPNRSYAGTTCAVGSRVMVFSVDYPSTASNQPDLHGRFIYKVYRDGSIMVVDRPQDNRRVPVLGLTFGDIAYANQNDEIFTNGTTSRSYSIYSNYTSTEYITNFLTNPYNYKALRAVSVTFEKLFKNPNGTGGSEQLDLYYRVSDREDWTLLGTVTAEKVIENVDTRRSEDVKDEEVPVNMQRYQFTKLPDNTALPEFNEIQFKFVLKNGMSITGAWFEYDYITRNTKR